MSTPFKPPQYRSATPQDFPFKTWQTIFHSARVQPKAFESNLTQSREHFTFIKELLTKNASALQTGTIDRRVFMLSVRLDDTNHEGATGISAEGYELLRQLRREQLAPRRTWAESVIVTTVMYNLVVATNSNSQLKLRRRSIRTVEAVLKMTNPQVHTSASNSSLHSNIFRFRVQTQEQVLRCYQPTNKACKLTFSRQYGPQSTIQRRRGSKFSACFSILQHEKVLTTRWEAIKKASTTGKSLKIKVKLLPGGASRVSSQSQENPPQPHQRVPASTFFQTDTAELRPSDNSVPVVQSPTPATYPPRASTKASSLHQQLQVSFASRAPAARIADEHLEELRKLSKNLHGVRGKWPHLLNVFRSYYP
ncbi:hypothetical protein F441_14604, partial [Phytophthora nicotianae CJ01A1]